jgi:hypothetical protein
MSLFQEDILAELEMKRRTEDARVRVVVVSNCESRYEDEKLRLS